MARVELAVTVRARRVAEVRVFLHDLEKRAIGAPGVDLEVIDEVLDLFGAVRASHVVSPRSGYRREGRSDGDGAVDDEAVSRACEAEGERGTAHDARRAVLERG